MQTSRILIIGLMAGAALALPSISRAAAGGVEGSPHDFSAATWQTRNGVCSPCHQAHHTDANQIAPLWAHETSAASFTPYSNPNSTLNATIGNPSGVSLACLSCHDGTVALNQSIGQPVPANPVYIAASAQIGPDLHTTHPISFTYDAALATADGGGLENPTTYKIGDAKVGLSVATAPVPATWSGTSLTGKTIDEAMLFNHQMECGSCHDVHRQEGSSATSGILARISGTDTDGRGSLLCRTCHIK